jgi:hypothetical protein
MEIPALMARTLAVPGYRIVAYLRFAPPWPNVIEASRGLVGLSNAVRTANWQRKMVSAKRVATNLWIDAIDPIFTQDWEEKS